MQGLYDIYRSIERNRILHCSHNGVSLEVHDIIIGIESVNNARGSVEVFIVQLSCFSTTVVDGQVCQSTTTYLCFISIHCGDSKQFMVISEDG